MVSALLQHSVLAAVTYDRQQTFVFMLIVTSSLSLALFGLSRWRRWTAVIAILLTLVWVAVRLPDLQYYYEIRHAPP
jgi:hypothetical protein